MKRTLITGLWILSLLALVWLAPAAYATIDSQSGKSLQAIKVGAAPQLDGVLDDAVWQQASAISDFKQYEPIALADASERTEIRVLYDDENLYIGAQLYDSEPTEVTRNFLSRQKRVRGDDRLVVVLDTFLDKRNGYFFEVNPNGIRADGLIENNTTLLEDWEGFWFAESRLNDQGWAVEVKIPFRALSFRPDGDTWGLNFYRAIARKNELLMWSNPGQVEAPLAPTWAGQLRGLQGMQQGLGLQVVPSLVLKKQRDFAAAETGAREDSSDFEPALDVLYKIDDSVTAALTLNTDFSATDVDDRIVNLSRFSPFLPEKRLFFLQDAGIFEFGDLSENARPFFSRTIGLDADGQPVDLQGGLKLTGRSGDWNYGFLGVRQDETDAIEQQDVFVARFVRNVLEQASVGVIATSGNPRGGPDNRLIGTDFRYRTAATFTGKPLEANLWWQRSDTEGLAGDDGAFGGMLRQPDDRHFVEAFYKEVQQNFDPALGFVNRAGIRDARLFYRFRTRPENSRWLANNYWLYLNRVTGVDNAVQTEIAEFSPWSPWDFNYYEPFLSFNREVVSEAFTLADRFAVPIGDYRFQRAILNVETAESGAWVFNGRIGVGEFFHGDQDELRTELTWKQSPHLTWKGLASFNQLRFPEGDFLVRLFRLKSTVAFNDTWSWVTVAQFDNVSEQLGINTRLQWLPQAGQEVFLMFNHGASRDPDQHFRAEQTDAVFKVSYAFQF
ncbi:carbohydrate binding family 9 domain-containing protein [Permianibacter sp. IMCC34836]|uniref:carbohydrate binding family 9 domain-containing protein n=1 Tax=Permianibacter fluminis TaxID=2738515 RepID=UPI001553915B|nr:carbohydrate binding family 9 domain-containing protein [Permianibacter fluminis]NQD37039.1 carbohydrate binding family 9 domain-containing protein [Permianibacter fluminis]